MEYASCLVVLGTVGDPIPNSVPKYGVTPAESVVLRAIHGDGCLKDLKVVGMDRRDHRQEYQRLLETYTKHDDHGEKVPMVEALFPGSNPRLPVKFPEVGIAYDAEEPAVFDEDKPKPKVAKVKKGKKAEDLDESEVEEAETVAAE